MPLILALYLKFLDKVAVPFQPGGKAIEVTLVIVIVGVVFDKLIGLLDGQIAPGQERRKATT